MNNTLDVRTSKSEVIQQVPINVISEQSAAQGCTWPSCTCKVERAIMGFGADRRAEHRSQMVASAFLGHWCVDFIFLKCLSGLVLEYSCWSQSISWQCSFLFYFSRGLCRLGIIIFLKCLIKFTSEIWRFLVCVWVCFYFLIKHLKIYIKLKKNFCPFVLVFHGYFF